MKRQTKHLACLASSIGLLALLGCNPLSPPQPAEPFPGLENAVKLELRDPVSAIFKNVRERGLYVCGEVNSKNGFGGYAGWMPFKALHTGNSWMIEWNNTGVPLLEELFVKDCGMG